MKFCTACGHQLPAGAKFCTRCGKAAAPVLAPIRDEYSSYFVADQQTAPPAIATAPAAPTSTPPWAGKSSKATLIVLLGLIFVGLLSAGAIWYVKQRVGDTSPDGAAASSAVRPDAASTGAPMGNSPASTNAPGSTQPSDSVTSSASSETSTEPNVTTVTESAPSASPSSVTDDATALTELRALRTTGIGSASLDGTWSAQIASQYVGVTDKTLQPTPFTAADILNLHRRLATDPRFVGQQVVMLKQNDFGKFVESSKEIWITMVLIAKPTSAEVISWCESAFGLSGKALENSCLPRQMVPLHR